MTHKSFENLEVWRRSARLSANIYKDLAALKDFGFRDQITRSGLSVPSNIAEGYERFSQLEKARFYSFAKGSAGELRTQIFIGMDIGYIGKEIGNEWCREITEISKILNKMITTQHQKAKDA